MRNPEFDATNLPPETCEHLCSKEIICGIEPFRDPGLVYPGDEECRAVFWCELTQDAQGPDGEIVDFQFCRTHRSCCVPRGVAAPAGIVESAGAHGAPAFTPADVGILPTFLPGVTMRRKAGKMPASAELELGAPGALRC